MTEKTIEDRTVCDHGGMSNRKVLILQHAPWERAGRIGDNLEDVGLECMSANVSAIKKPQLPKPHELAGLVLLGGPMRADDYENYPGLKAETKLAKAAQEAGIPVLGVCLGHQIVSRALGGKLNVGTSLCRGFEQVKWVASDDAVSSWLDKKTPVLQWHSDSVTLPPGAKLLAKSSTTKVEAFRQGSAVGVQFHLEVTQPLFEQWLERPEVTDGMKKSQIEQLVSDFQDAEPMIQPIADSLFSAFAARCLTYTSQYSD